MKKTNRGYRIEVAGHSQPELYFVVSAECGRIKDGVYFCHGDEGGWVISYKDLLEMAKKATEFRIKNQISRQIEIEKNYNDIPF